MVELNRAAAVAMAFGAEAGLQLMDAQVRDGALSQYYPAYAARADLLRRAGRHEEAVAAYRRALALCQNSVEVRFLRRRLGEVDGHE